MNVRNPSTTVRDKAGFSYLERELAQNSSGVKMFEVSTSRTPGKDACDYPGTPSHGVNFRATTAPGAKKAISSNPPLNSYGYVDLHPQDCGMLRTT